MIGQTYAASALAGAQACRPLDSLAGAAQRVNTAQVQISMFLDRWHGKETPEQPPSANAPEPNFPHSTNLSRLFEALDRLETRVEALNQIG